MHVLYIELSMRLLFREVAPARPGMGDYSLVSEQNGISMKECIQ
jgi:hypothetical protein